MRAGISEEEPRSGPRSNIFLVAILTTDAKSCTVRVRNLSHRGALLEASGLPEAGTRVWLRRGSLDSEGEVAWAKGAHCGVRFVSPIAVEEWVARAGPVGQQRIDAAIAELRDLCFKGHIDVGDFVAELRDLCERMNAHPHMTVGIAEQILKIEAAAHAIRSAATRY